jgi:hypothetical protein
MKKRSFAILIGVFALNTVVSAQDATGLSGTLIQGTSDSQMQAPYIFKEWYPGTIRTTADKVVDGVIMRYDLVKDIIEYRQGSDIYSLSGGVKEFSIPTNTDLYIFKNGYPAVDQQSPSSFYRVLYEGNVTLLKRYHSPILVEKASPTQAMDKDSRLYILKDGKLSPVKLSDKNSFLRLLSDERNKMLYTIKEQQLEFGAANDLISLLEEYDSFKAGRGGN